MDRKPCCGDSNFRWHGSSRVPNQFLHANERLRASLLVVVIACAGFLPGSGAMAAEDDGAVPHPYLFGVFPHLTTARLEKIWAPMAADLGRATGRRVILHTRSTFEDFVAELDQEKFDIAFIQPFDYVRARQRYGMIPLARFSRPLSGVIVVGPNSPVKSLADLRGRMLALPPEVAAVSHLVKVYLLQHGIDPAKDLHLQYVRSHDSCLQQVLVGRMDACGTAEFPIRFYQKKMEVQFREIGRSPAIPHALIAVHPRVPEQDREAVRKAILSLPDRPEGRRILENAGFNPFAAANDAEYEVVRAYSQGIRRQAQ